MPRSARLVIPNVPHHVIVRGNNRRNLFSYLHEYVTFIAIMRKGLKRTGCALHACALMKNHVHLLVTPPAKESLPQFVKYVCQVYAQRRNQHRDGSGKLFEERYQSHVIHDESYLVRVTAYIDLNPTRAGLRAGRHRAYPYSTLHLHIGQASAGEIPPDIITFSRAYLSFGLTQEQRAQNYAQLVEKYADEAMATDQMKRLIHDDVAAALKVRRNQRFLRPNGTHAI